MTVERLHAAALGCALGLDGYRVLTLEDEFERRILLEVIERGTDIRKRLVHDEAVEIANALVKSRVLER